MTSLVTLKKLDKNKTLVYTYNFDTFRTFDVDINTPVYSNPLPQNDSSEQILIKVGGNSTVVKFSWVLKKETTSVVTEVSTINTPAEQMEFWRGSMRAVNIDDNYEFRIKYSDSSTESVYQGTLNNVHFSTSDQQPGIYVGSFEFFEGTVVSGGYEKDGASAPQNIGISSPGAGQFTVTWTTSKDPGSQVIDYWKVKWMKPGTSWSESPDINPATFSYNKTGLSAGTYTVQVFARGDGRLGQGSSTITQVVA